MGFMKSVYLNSNLFESCNKEPNLSGLISQLLEEHFNKNKTMDIESMNVIEIRNKLKYLEDRYAQTNITIEEHGQIELAVKTLKDKESEIMQTEEARKTREQKKHEERLLSFADSFKVFFDVNEEQSKQLALEFSMNTEYGTIFDFGKQKGLKEKEIEETVDDELKEVFG